MIYVDSDKHLQTEEVCVVRAEAVSGLVHDGWRILAILQYQEVHGPHTQIPTNDGPLQISVPVIQQLPQFVMGRDVGNGDLAARLKDAESAQRNAEQNEASLQIMHDKAVEDRERAEESNRIALDNVAMQAEIARKATERLSEVCRHAGLIRAEIGEARWREILHALEIEDVLGKGA